MTYSNDVLEGPELENQESLQFLLNHDCSYWKTSSQAAADLYDSGVKLWTKMDLRDIEEQLAQSYTKKSFTVRCIDGNMLHLQNPIFGVERSIWKPYVEFQEYWRLVKEQPKGPPQTYHCSYLVGWRNQTVQNFRELLEKPDLIFEERKDFWSNSRSCELLRSHLEELLGTRKVTKIICFGLGDMCRQPPDWLKRQRESEEPELNGSDKEHCMIQHSIALTLANAFSSHDSNAIQLLAQDPDYTEEAIKLLEKNGFRIVGMSGAGGFAEIDDESVVFSPFVSAPVKQIIADIARPALIISDGFGAFNDHEKPWADADSPRTKRMWQEYQSHDFPISSEDARLIGGGLHKLKLYVRN